MGQIDWGYDISTTARLMLPDQSERASLTLLDVLDCDPERMEPIFIVKEPAAGFRSAPVS